MIKSYLIIAIRNLRKHKGYSFINISGLAVGISCCIIILLYVRNELSYDKFYKNADSIYRVYIKSSINGQKSSNCKTAAPLGNTLVHDFPEVINSTRIGFFGNHALKYKDKLYRERHLYTADSNFFDVFSLPLIKGNPNTALSQPNNIVMTQSAAEKYFGNENPVGKILRADSQQSFMVTGLMKDFPPNSSFRCDILLSMSTYPVARSDYWLDMNYVTYITLKKGTDPVIFQKKLQKIVYDNISPQVESALGIPFSDFINKGNTWGFYLQPLTSIYLYSKSVYGIDPNTEWFDQNTSDIEYVYIFSAVALFILLLAIINFINLTTTRSETRSKEVGIKKTLGSNKTKLIGQFLTEFIACLGLFGLASFVSEQRKKEIGIRKVLGASIFELIIMLSKEFTRWVLAANLIAWPAAYLIMNNWLTNFAYRTNISIGVFLLSGIAALIIALVTVSAHAIKAAAANPVESLHYE